MIEGPIVYNFICNVYTTHNYLVTVRCIGKEEGGILELGKTHNTVTGFALNNFFSWLFLKLCVTVISSISVKIFQ